MQLHSITAHDSITITITFKFQFPIQLQLQLHQNRCNQLQLQLQLSNCTHPWLTLSSCIQVQEMYVKMSTHQ